MAVEGYADAVARWLRAAMRNSDGTDRMTDTELIKKSGVGRSTLYRYIRGEGEAEEAKLAKLAHALKVPTPRTVRTLHFDQPQIGRLTPLAKLRESRALLDEAIERLEKDR